MNKASAYHHYAGLQTVLRSLACYDSVHGETYDKYDKHMIVFTEETHLPHLALVPGISPAFSVPAAKERGCHLVMMVSKGQGTVAETKLKGEMPNLSFLLNIPLTFIPGFT